MTQLGSAAKWRLCSVEHVATLDEYDTSPITPPLSLAVAVKESECDRRAARARAIPARACVKVASPCAARTPPATAESKGHRARGRHRSYTSIFHY
jgi:hypothetical protein